MQTRRVDSRARVSHIKTSTQIRLLLIETELAAPESLFCVIVSADELVILAQHC